MSVVYVIIILCKCVSAFMPPGHKIFLLCQASFTPSLNYLYIEQMLI